MATVLAVDGGGTKVCVHIVTGTGEILAQEIGPPCSLAMGVDKALASLCSTLHKALTTATDSWHRVYRDPFIVNAACLGLSGISTLSLEAQVRPVIQRTLRRAGQTLPDERLLIVSDMRIAHEAALGGAPGIVLIGGTGAVAYARTPSGEELRSDGWGWLLGDDGSGYAIGRDALRAAFAAHDGRAPSTALQHAVPFHYNEPDLPAVATAVYAGRISRTAIASLAPVVMDLAAQGDAVAQAVRDRAARALANTVLSLMRRPEWHGSEMIGTMGGLFQENPDFEHLVQHYVAEGAPGHRYAFVRSDATPIHGAVRLAREAAMGNA